jgi:outer membrane immunogenic protein
MKYNPLLLSPLGLIPMGMPAADAADMAIPVKAPPPQATAYTPSWAGFYGGLNVGVLSARSKLGAFLPTSADYNYCWLGDCNFNASPTATGVMGGVQIGYNFQSGNIVYGAEIDYGLSSAKKSVSGVNVNDSRYSYVGDIGIESFGSARLRLGYAFDNSAMVYATGGLAFAKVRDSFQAIFAGVPYSWTGTGWRTGYTVGGGLEYMFDPHWSVKGEALYYDLGSKKQESTFTGDFTFSHGLTDKMTGVIARIGLNYLFH